MTTEVVNAEHTIGIVGNPNSGKSTLFNLLTGLRQKVGNYPGVTVDKKVGWIKTDKNQQARIIDYPGLYSVYPNSSDEQVLINILTNKNDPDYPDLILYVADVNALDRHLLLVTQLIDLKIPVVLLLNMLDIAESEGLTCDHNLLSKELDIPVIPISSKTGKNLSQLKKSINYFIDDQNISEHQTFYHLNETESNVSTSIKQALNLKSDYLALLYAHHSKDLSHLTSDEKKTIDQICEEENFSSTLLQIEETLNRYARFGPIIHNALQRGSDRQARISGVIDRIITHRVVGPIIFLAIMLFVFQAIFAWAEYPMNWIESGFAALGSQLKAILPPGYFSDLMTDGILAGLGGIMVFIPQIAILFLLISFLEEIGYMSRAVFMFDRIMQFFGLNGRSIVALVSGSACAIPAIMSTRTISNWKERMITILVTPLISCSARIPVYTVLIGFVIPATTVWGIFNAQGLAFMGLYLLGIAAALASAFAFKLILNNKGSSRLMMELPHYKKPDLTNILTTVKEKVLTFIIEAGKIILIISVVLWVLASFGPAQKMQQATIDAEEIASAQNLDVNQTADLISAKKIEASYAGHLGKAFEPVIKPLGFDWKIGIALITSFAAREVFVGTMATIYSIGSNNDEFTVRDKMAMEINPETGKPVYSLATSLSLLIFYVFAMQCMSTLAVTKRETKSWKWPVIQFSFMSIMAYIGSLIIYQMFA